MVLFRNIDGWIDRAEACFAQAAHLGVEGPPAYRIQPGPDDLPGIDVLMAGQPGSGKSTLGNLVLGYRDAPLLAGREPAAELPRFAEEMVSLARRFPERYKGAHTIPVSTAQARTLPSLPAVLGVRFTELWGMSAGERAARGSMMEKLIDAHPSSAAIVLVVRADQQLDAPERELLAEIVTSPWKDSVMVLLNLRSTGHDAEQIIKLKGFVEEQCIGIGLAPRGVYALDAHAGTSPVDGEVERFGAALTDVLVRLWSAEHARHVTSMLAGPLEELEERSLARAEVSRESLEAETAEARGQVEEALERSSGRRRAALRAVERLATKAMLETEEDLVALSGSEVARRPRETLRQFRREAVKEIEHAMDGSTDTSGWPVPDLAVRQRPGPGCLPVGASIVAGIVTIIVTVAALWPLTAAFGVVTVGFAALAVGTTIKARRRWRTKTMSGFKDVLDEQLEAARALAEKLHTQAHDPAKLAPGASERLERLEAAARIVHEVKGLESELESLVSPGEDLRPDGPRPGDHARRMASALAAGRPLDVFFHENGFDLDAPDLFARICEIEYALRPLAHLQSIETVRGWLRPPLARRERAIYPYLDRLRMRWDELEDRTRSLLERLVRRSEEAPSVRCTVEDPGGAGPRLAVAEEALEAILARILDEAARHAFAGSDEKPSAHARWSLEARPSGTDAVLAIELHASRGFDEAGRRAFDSGRGGLSRFLADAREGGLGWCSEIEITTRDGDEVWARSVHEPDGAFSRSSREAGPWATRLVLVMPAVIEERG